MPRGQRNAAKEAPAVEQAKVLARVGANAADLVEQPAADTPIAPPAADPVAESPKQGKVKTVPMEREGKNADVHPNEVEHMQKHGWTVKG